MVILEAAPVNRTETLEQVVPAKIGLALTKGLVANRKPFKGEWRGLEYRQETFDQEVAEDRRISQV